ncbi:MAG TPA: hypothetical protein VGV14_12625 [Rhodanobacter sp.]|nr:hypothetical protein [Rhodanobacter sp.]
MQRIKHLSLSPAFEAALVERLGAGLQLKKASFHWSKVALLVSLIVVLVILTVLLIAFIHH